MKINKLLLITLTILILSINIATATINWNTDAEAFIPLFNQSETKGNFQVYGATGVYNETNGHHMDFDGTNDYLDLNSILGFVDGDDITINVIVESDSIATSYFGTIVSNYNGANNGFGITWYEDTIRCSNEVSPGNVKVKRANSLSANTKYNISCTIDGGTGDVTLLLNGVTQTDTAYSAGTVTQSDFSSETFKIGSQQGTTRYFNGQIYSVEIKKGTEKKFITQLDTQTDISNNDNNIQGIDGVEFDEGRYFNGAEYERIDQSTLTNGDSFSITTTITADNIGDTTQNIVWRSLNIGNSYIRVRTNQISAGVYTDASNYYIKNSGTLSSNTEYEVKAIFHSNGDVDLYIDDVEQTGVTSAGSVTTSYIGTETYVGATETGTLFYNGHINNLHLYSDTTQTTSVYNWTPTDSYDFDGTDDYMDFNSHLNLINDATFSTCAWYNIEDFSKSETIIGLRDSYSISVTSSGDLHAAWKGEAGSWSTAVDIATTKKEWHLACFTFNSGTAYLYNDKTQSSAMTLGDTTLYDSTYTVTIGRGNLVNYADIYDGKIQNIIKFNKALTSTEVSDLFDEGRNYNPYYIPDTPVTNESADRTESTALVKQISPVTVNTPGLTTVVSSTFEVPINGTPIYGVYTLDITSTHENSAYCEVIIDGVTVGNKTRSNDPGDQGDLVIKTTTFLGTNGTHTQEIACSKSGAGTYTVENAVGTGHFLVDEEGNFLNYKDIIFTNTSTSGASYTLLAETNFTVSEDNLTNKTYYLVSEWTGEYTNNHGIEEELNTYIEITGTNGLNCSNMPRDVDTTKTGSVGSDCLLKNATANETYNFKIYGLGTNAEYSISLTIKEFALSPGEIDGGQGLLVGTNFSGNTDTKLVEIPGGNLNHGLTNVFQKQAYSIQCDEDTNVNMYVKLIDGDTWTSVDMKRDFTANKIGVLIGQDVFQDVPQDDYNISVWANAGSPTATCTIEGGAGIGYITDVTTTLFEGFYIRVNNDWDNTTVNNFTSVDGVTFNSESGILSYFTTEEIVNFTITSNEGNGYINKTFTNYNTSNDLNTTLYQTILNVQSTEINTNSYLDNWTLHTEKQDFSTTNGTVTLYPNIGTYSWNWSNTIGYFNQDNLGFTIDEINENLTISNLYARNLEFYNNKSISTQITPNCTQSGYTYNSYPYYLPKDNTQLDCNLFSYQDTTFTLNTTMPENGTYYMEPAILNLIFTEQTTGYVETSECSENNDCSFFNATAIYVEQYNISQGYVTVKFNPDENNNWQQIFKYYNDEDTHVKQYIKIETPDLAQQVRVSGDGSVLKDARVCAKSIATNPDTGLNDWLTTYCDFTDQDGYVTLLINDQDTYQICVQKEGFESDCVQEFIPPANANVISIDLTGTDSVEGFNLIQSSCASYYYENKTCTLSIVTYKVYNTIEIRVNNSEGSAITSYSDSSGLTASYELDSNKENYTIEVFFNGEIEKIISHIYNQHDADYKIDYTNREYDGQTFRERLEQTPTHLYVFYVIVIFLGLGIGYIFENKLNDYGVYGTGVWFIVIGAGGFPMLFVPALPIALYFIADVVMPSIK